MSVRKHPTKGPGWWQIEWYPEGRKGGKKRLTFNGTELKARSLEAKLRKQTKGLLKSSLYPRINEVTPAYIEWYRNNHMESGTERTIRSLKILLTFFGTYQFTSITNALVEEYKANRLKSVSPSTIQKELATLSGICKFASKQGYCRPIKIERFPAKLTKAPLPEILTREEITRFIAALKSQEKRGFFSCLYYAGMRSAEAKTLTVENCFLERGLVIARGKGNKQRPIPVAADLFPILEERIKVVGSGLLFPGDFRETIAWAKKRAGLDKKITPHIFRHCFGVHSIEKNINLRSLQLIMGHSTSVVTEGYTNMAAEALIEEMTKF